MEIIKKGEIEITIRDLSDAREMSLNSLPDIAGVYFLFNDNILIYIGQTKNLKQRIITHHYARQRNNNIKQFNKIFFLESENKEERTNLELFNSRKYLNDIRYHSLIFEF